MKRIRLSGSKIYRNPEEVKCDDCGVLIINEGGEAMMPIFYTTGDQIYCHRCGYDQINVDYETTKKSIDEMRDRKISNWVNRVNGTLKMLFEEDDYSDFYDLLTEAIYRVRVPEVFYVPVYNECVRQNFRP
jgi:hypothetical protein